jgi:hypothetical protein
MMAPIISALVGNRKLLLLLVSNCVVPREMPGRPGTAGCPQISDYF